MITQNVDDLHERAGSPKVLHLHGSLHAPRCADCRAPWSRAEPASADAAAAGTTAADIRTADAATASAAASGAPSGEQDEGRRIEPPRCATCGGPVRPGVVWFGESLPADAWRAAQLAAEQCDLLLSIGTSALVYPAAELPQRALAAGAVVAQVNPAATPMDARVKFNLRGQAADVLPRLLQSAGI